MQFAQRGAKRTKLREVVRVALLTGQPWIKRIALLVGVDQRTAVACCQRHRHGERQLACAQPAQQPVLVCEPGAVGGGVEAFQHEAAGGAPDAIYGIVCALMWQPKQRNRRFECIGGQNGPKVEGRRSTLHRFTVRRCSTEPASIELRWTGIGYEASSGSRLCGRYCASTSV